MSENKNPLLEAHNIPGETFRLPSGGVFYTRNELDESVKQGEVHVYPMRTVDELIMKSPDKILTGKAVEEVFGRCIPDILKPDELLANDVEYLMAAIRVVSYGENAEINFTHDCEDAKEHNYVVNIRDILKDAREIDPTSLDKRYTFELDGFVLSIRPPRYKSIVSLYQTLGEDFMKDADEELVASTLVKNLGGMIESVNGHSDAEHIVEWLLTIKAGWINQIAEFTRENSNWGIEYNRLAKCKDCKKEFEISVPTNPITFFT